ncbi:MAG: hypothetical protein JRH01_14935 [Deltaproteobacteria bacterium]|nr:hypothetical protein [Deltaproteobacteria bacterium]
MSQRPVYVLGISAFYHDSAAALVCDGQVVAAAQEERFTRKKHDPRFPVHAINACLEAAEIEAEELAGAVFYENPLLSLDRILRSVAGAGEAALPSWLEGLPGWLRTKLFFEELLREELGQEIPVLYSEHHLSHAASAFYPSPYDEAAILTIDGVGEWATTTLAEGDADGLRVHQEIRFPHSLGLLYSAFTQYCGFRVNSGEYKLMGLAPYGEPIYAERIRDHLIDLREDGSYELAMDHFAFVAGETMTNDLFHGLFEGPPRERESRIRKKDADLAASIQAVTEEAVLCMARHLRKHTGCRNLVMAGGVALNCVANGKLLREGIFEKLWIQPAAGDAGGALGAAYVGSHVYFDVPRVDAPAPGRDRQRGSYLGPAYSNEEVRSFLDLHDLPYEVVSDDERARETASALATGQVVGYMVGRTEFGPRSLGARSILGDPRSTETQSVMNLKIKFRESFRPFAPSVLLEASGEFFDLEIESPYMLLVAPVKEEIRLPVASDAGAEDEDNLIAQVNQKRSSLPAITHVDYSARVQTVDGVDKPDYHAVIREFQELTGVGCVVNSSFNVRGEPMVLSPWDAYKCFMRTDMDVLVVENFLLRKTEQPKFEDRENWQEEYELD